jgi:cytochrome bd ubiquinol oxidase subunit II
VFGWLNFFSVSVGVFTIGLCGFLAAVYLIAEAQDENDRLRFIRKARTMNIASFLAGLLVFIAAIIDDVPLLQWIFGNAWGILAFAMATVSLSTLWIAIRARSIWIPRIMAAFQVSMILFAVTFAHFPDFIILKDGTNLSLFEHQAPEKTMTSLGTALLIGSIFILPALYYLYYSFKSVDPESARSGDH